VQTKCYETGNMSIFRQSSCCRWDRSGQQCCIFSPPWQRINSTMVRGGVGRRQCK